MTQKECIGFGAIDSLKSILVDFSAKKIFLVIGKISYSKCGAKKCLDRILADYEVKTFSEFDRNPKIEDLNKGIEAFSQVRGDVVIALGGGSVIDMAKMINFFGSNELDPKVYVTEKKADANIEKGKPLIAIPTTAGTGSEATHFAVLYIQHKKFSATHNHILPDVAIVDPQFTMSLPPKITASSGMDALSQAVESYWCINSDDESKGYAKESIELILPNLPVVVNSPTESSRSMMAEAAHLAGKAINITKTTAPHAVSYPLTSFFGIPHGHAVGLTLSSFLVYNFNVTSHDTLDQRGCDYVKKSVCEIAGFLGQNSVAQSKQKIDDLMHEIGLETRLSSLGIESKEDIEVIIENGFNPERVKNNPRRLTEETLRAILYSVY